MMKTSLKVCLAASVICLWNLAPANADEKPLRARPVAEGLDNPSGVAVNAETGHVFFCTRAGVHRLVPGKAGKVYSEVTGFPTDIYGKGPMYDIGPLGVAFLDNEHLVVGDGSRPDGEELVRVYKVGKEPLSTAASEGSAAFTLGPIPAGDASAKGEGNFYGVTTNQAGIFITANGDDTKGWVLRATVQDGKPGELKPFIASKEATGTDAPVAITTDAEGRVVIGQMGEMNLPGDSLLTFYDAESGELIRSLPTGLSDIAGLAYSPKSGKLYCVDFSWAKPEDGGLFELTVTDDAVKTNKILSLDKPTALAFDKRGRLYVTVYGTAAEGSEEKGGQLLVVRPGL
ncbi:MAG: hypothetical protein KDA78_03320 [Planctomycetaceae bacterium]|nr:hypothetical protein [Planctomycetaceae bacterium]